ncbi:MAG: pentapeptide repeat-containing protein, partial [Maribacter sp.]|nr:pentapeptide repeat-containing protein [Maribacter sp.]
LIAVDYTAANLTEAFFNTCNLEKTVFENSNLEKADFTTSFNFTIDPERNRLKKAKFSKENVDGLLSKYDILIK